MNEGFYTVVTFKCEGDFPAELQRLMNIDESVLRAMVIRLEYDAALKAAEAPDIPEAPAEDVPADETPAEEVPAEEATATEAAPADAE